MTMIAPCVKCGKAVVMLKVRDTGLAVAMDPFEPGVPYWTESVGMGYSQAGSGYAQPGGGYVEHGCDVDVVRQYQSTWLGQVNIHNELNAQAMTIECPKCGAQPGEKCINLMERAKGRKVNTKAPHSQRYQPVGEVDDDDGV